MQTPRRAQPFVTQFADLLRIELTNWRWTWRLTVVLGMGGPFATIVALRFLLGTAGPDTLGYVLAGNLALALIFDNQMRVGSHFEFMRFHGTFDYFASLPVSKSALIVAVAAAFFILSMPAVLVLTLIGPPVLGLSLHPSPAVLLVLPFCALPMAGVGALIGLYARTPAEASSMGMLVTLLLAGVGAVMIPPDRLPPWFVTLGRVSPATYSASALRQTLLGPMTNRLWLDLSMLAGFAGATFWAVTRKLDWRRT
jgi:ABC-2 type transport system permease protein